MVQVNRLVAERHLRRQDPGSTLADHLARASRPRLSEDDFAEQVETYRDLGAELSSAEVRAVQQVNRVLTAPSLWSLVDGGEGLAEVAKPAKPPRRGRRSLPSVASFSATGAPRWVSGEAVKGKLGEWEAELPDTCFGMPVLGRGGLTLYAHDESGGVHAFSAVDGKTQWKLELGVEYGGAMALHPDARRLFTVAGRESCEALCIDTQTQAIRWRVPVGDGKTEAGYCSPLTLSPDGSRLFLRDSKGELQAFETETGKPCWPERVSLGAAAGGDYHEHPVVSPDGSRVVCSDGQSKLYCYDAATGEQLWSASRGQKGTSGVFTPDGERFVASGGPWLTAFDVETGEEQWEVALVQALPDTSGPLVTREGARVVVFDGMSQLLDVDAQTGDVLQSIQISPVSAFLRGSPVLLPDDTTVLVTDEEGAHYAVDLKAGSSRKVGEGDPCNGSCSVSPDGRFAYVNCDSSNKLQSVALTW